MYGLMRGRWKRAAGLLDRDTRPKGEKRSGVAGPHVVPRHCSTLQRNKFVAVGMQQSMSIRSSTAVSSSRVSSNTLRGQ